MKKIKALCYTHPIMGLTVHQNLMPAKEYKLRYGVEVFSCSIVVPDKVYKKIKKEVEQKEKRQKAEIKQLKNQPKFKIVLA